MSCRSILAVLVDTDARDARTTNSDSKIKLSSDGVLYGNRETAGTGRGSGIHQFGPGSSGQPEGPGMGVVVGVGVAVGAIGGSGAALGVTVAATVGACVAVGVAGGVAGGGA